MALDFATTVKRLAQEKGTSVNKVGFSAYDPNVKGTNPDTFKSVMAGRRRPTIVLMRAVAEALGEPPQVFMEYRLAIARSLLDETGPGGLESAARYLGALTELAVDAGMRETRGDDFSTPSGPGTATRDAAELLGQGLLEAAQASRQAGASLPTEEREPDRRQADAEGGAA